ncbi:MAG TPA: phenylalanine--tRNA ligase subunit alpha, partial [Thermomicrobiales bacterium]|nr:phenylalanine--tRNA ligase subunit alpha [Thermomicrobiales bacterium]
MTAQESINDIRTRAVVELEAATSLDEIVAWERAFLGPKGELTLVLRGLASLPADQRPIAGRGGNALKTELTAAWSARHAALVAENLEQRLAADAVDVTLPGRPPILGASHPVSQMIDELSEIFALLGFQTVFGPEVETAHYNFDLLNIPSDHPARDVWDTI